jgi:hypothetical protein
VWPRRKLTAALIAQSQLTSLGPAFAHDQRPPRAVALVAMALHISAASFPRPLKMACEQLVSREVDQGVDSIGVDSIGLDSIKERTTHDGRVIHPEPEFAQGTLLSRPPLRYELRSSRHVARAGS